MKIIKKLPTFLATFCCIGILISMLTGSSDTLFYSIGCIVFAIAALVINAREKRNSLSGSACEKAADDDGNNNRGN